MSNELIWLVIVAWLTGISFDIDQARRLADYVLFMWPGELVEHGPAAQVLGAPRQALSQAYLAREVG